MGLETAAIIGLAGAAAKAGGAIGSFVQAGKERQRMEAAERSAAQAMQDAKDKLQSNFYEGLSVQKEPYELEREAALSGLGQIVQAGQAGERGVGEIAGRAAIYNQGQQAATRTAMGKEMQALDKLVAAEDSRLRDARAKIDLAEAQGQQQIAADARAARSAANQQGVAGLVGAAESAGGAFDLYGGGSNNELKALGKLANNKTFNTIQNRLGENPSFSDVFGSVSSTPVVPFDPNFDPNSVQVLEEDIIFEK
jgi:hypothetical protein